MGKDGLAATSIAGIRLSNPLMNAAYLHSKTASDVKRLAKSACGAVVVGSITVEARKPNKDGGYWRHKDGLYSLNSFGMPNAGYTYFEEQLPALVRTAHENNKPLIANIAGFLPEEFARLIKLAEQSKADMAELNLGCPNAWEGGNQKRIISYHPSLVGEVLAAVKSLKTSVKVCVKISPLPPDLLRDIANEVSKSNCVDAVTATNSYPNAYFTSGTGKPTDILTGMTGRSLKPISLGVVKQLRGLLPESVDIIGCGGISSVNDVRDYIEAGASAVQLATALMDEGLEVFSKLALSSKES